MGKAYKCVSAEIVKRGKRQRRDEENFEVYRCCFYCIATQCRLQCKLQNFIIFFFKFLEKFNLLSKSFMFLFILFSLVSILKLYFSCLNPWLIDYWKDFNLVLEVYVKVQFSFQSFLFWHFYPFSFKCLRFNLTTSFLIRFLIHCKKVQFNPFF
jgi:hypothetical protein